MSDLLKVAESGDVLKLETVIRDWQFTQDDLQKALYIARDNNHLDVLKALLQLGPYVRPFLLDSIEKGDLDVVELCYEINSVLSKINYLNHAHNHNQSHIVDSMLDRIVTYVNSIYGTQWFSLMCRCDIKLVKKFVDKFISKNDHERVGPVGYFKDKCINKLFEHSISKTKETLQLEQWLIENGASLRKKFRSDRPSHLYKALSYKYLETAKFLIQSGASLEIATHHIIHEKDQVAFESFMVLGLLTPKLYTILKPLKITNVLSDSQLKEFEPELFERVSNMASQQLAQQIDYEFVGKDYFEELSLHLRNCPIGIEAQQAKERFEFISKK